MGEGNFLCEKMGCAEKRSGSVGLSKKGGSGDSSVLNVELLGRR